MGYLTSGTSGILCIYRYALHFLVLVQCYCKDMKIHPYMRWGKVQVFLVIFYSASLKRVSLTRGHPWIFWLDFADFSSSLALFPAYKFSAIQAIWIFLVLFYWVKKDQFGLALPPDILVRFCISFFLCNGVAST